MEALDANGYRYKWETVKFKFIEPKTEVLTMLDRMKIENKILIKVYPNVCLMIPIA